MAIVIFTPVTYIVIISTYLWSEKYMELTIYWHIYQVAVLLLYHLLILTVYIYCTGMGHQL